MLFLTLAIVALPYVSALKNEDSKTIHVFKNPSFDASKCIGGCAFRDFQKILPHEDCSKFCKCVLGHLKVKKCPKNKHYSTESKRCELPKIAMCQKQKGCVGTCPEKDWPDVVHILPHTDCEMFCKCKNGTALPRNCPYDFKFNIDRGICYPLNEIHCISDENITTTTPKTEESCIGSCSSDSDDLVYLPHPDCSKYCLCIDSKPKEMQCENNLHFSPELKKCVTPAEANCMPDANNTTTPPTTTTSSTTPKFEEGCIDSCPLDSDDFVFLPHANCSKYCMCINGNPQEQECKNNQHFSAELKKCVTPAEANCSPNVSITTTPPTTTPKFEGECIGLCPSESNDFIYLPHQNCSRYCICINGKLLEQECKHNLHFSIELTKCLTPAEANCTNQSLFI